MMKYFTKSLGVYKRSLHIILLLNLVPALLCGLYATPFKSVYFLADYGNLASGNFFDILGIMFDLPNFVRIYPILLLVVVVVLFFALGFSVYERYLRIGKMTLAQPMGGINITLLPTLVTLGLVTIFMCLFKVVIASIATLLHLLLSGVGVVVTTANLVALSVICVLAFLACMGLFLWLFLLMPTMTI